jgi:hypothetical protein
LQDVCLSLKFDRQVAWGLVHDVAAVQAGWGNDPINGPRYTGGNNQNPNYGIVMPNCLQQCGTPPTGGIPTFGAAGRPIGTDCEACPVIKTGFYFAWDSQVKLYKPDVVAPDIAESSGDCLAEFGQVGDMGAWYVGGAAPLVAVPLTDPATTFEDCAAACKQDAACEYITYDYKATALDKKCFKKVNSDADKQYARLGCVISPCSPGDVVLSSSAE